MKRREFLQIAALSAVSSGCGEEAAKQRMAAGGAMAVAGGLIVLLPHPAAKVIGAVLTHLGGALGIDYETLIGAVDHYSHRLSDDELPLAQPGVDVTVRYRNAKGSEEERILRLRATIDSLERRLREDPEREQRIHQLEE